MMKTITEVASELGVKHWHIRHAFDAGHLDKPPIFSNRFVFTDNHVEDLKLYFSRKEHDATTLAEILD
jgi:hypothetical protein